MRAARSGEPWYADAAAAQDALADAPPAQQQALVRATRPFFYGRWDERTQEHAATADRQSSRRAELGFAAGAEEVDVPALLAALRRLAAPVLVVGGERDALTGVASVGRVAASFPAAQSVVLPRAGHFPWVDEPAAFRAAVEPFLAGPQRAGVGCAACSGDSFGAAAGPSPRPAPRRGVPGARTAPARPLLPSLPESPDDPPRPS